jgi:hypothetical protein
MSAHSLPDHSGKENTKAIKVTTQVGNAKKRKHGVNSVKPKRKRPKEDNSITVDMHAAQEKDVPGEKDVPEEKDVPGEKDVPEEKDVPGEKDVPEEKGIPGKNGAAEIAATRSGRKSNLPGHLKDAGYAPPKRNMRKKND